MSFFVAPTRPRNEETDAFFPADDDALILVALKIPLKKRAAFAMICRRTRRIMRRALGEEPNLVDEQVEAFFDVMRGENVLITGGAGVGKSHLLKAIIKYLPQKGLAVTASTGCAAAVIGAATFHSTASRAHDKGCPWHNATCELAAENGELQCLKYAHVMGCPWVEVTCGTAAANGHLACLKYAHEHGCPWDERTCAGAAENGHLECLQYAHDKGCPWDESTCKVAADKGHLACLKYAHEHGCQWDGDTREGAAENGHGTSRHARLPLTKATSQASNMPTNTAVHGTEILELYAPQCLAVFYPVRRSEVDRGAALYIWHYR